SPRLRGWPPSAYGILCMKMLVMQIGSTRGVIPREPGRDPVQARKENALGHVRLVELVPYLRPELRRDDDLPDEVGMPLDPLHEREPDGRDDGEEGVLVDDARVERRRLEEQHELLLERVHPRRRLGKQLGCEDVRTLAL